jgi:hypothetical protein
MADENDWRSVVPMAGGFPGEPRHWTIIFLNASGEVEDGLVEAPNAAEAVGIVQAEREAKRFVALYAGQARTNILPALAGEHHRKFVEQVRLERLAVLEAEKSHG